MHILFCLNLDQIYFISEVHVEPCASKHVSNYTYLFKMIVFLQIEKWGFLDQSFQREQIIWAFFF